MSCDADKENDSHVGLTMSKKRTKVTTAPVASKRTTSRSKPAASQVLSPKSYNTNSRNLVRSPIRPTTSPAKSNIARPVSPLKPLPPPVVSATSNGTTSIPTGVVAGMVEKIKSARTAATRKVTPAAAAAAPAPTGRAKRTVARPATSNAAASVTGRGRAASNSSHASVSTTGTVVTRLKGKAAVPAQKAEEKVKAVVGRAGGLTAAAKKAASAAAVEVPAVGKRMLRKRK
jgi:hypothetical protein